jgi:lipoprotein-anchoring transpeptidase ErfK/SrfK
MLALMVGGCALPQSLLSSWNANTSEERIPASGLSEPSAAPEQLSPTTTDQPSIAPETATQVSPQPETVTESSQDTQDVLPVRPLAPGSKGKAVVLLQEMLLEMGFYREKIDGLYGKQTRAAVTAAQKALGLPIDKQWREEHWQALLVYQGPTLPERPAQPDRVEIDLEKQLLYLVKANRVVAIMPISSGNGETYKDRWGHTVRADTPVGSYTLYRRLNGWRESYLGKMYRPWYFFEGYAVHGSGSVPPKPVSHGCVRVPMWDADYLAEELKLGMPLYVWGDPETERSHNENGTQQLVDPTIDALKAPVEGAES